MLTIYKPAENAPIAAQKRLKCLKQKDWSKRGVPTTSTRWSDHLGRQFLTTASTFPHSSKNSSAEHIHDVSTCLILTNTLNHIDKYTHTHTHKQTMSLSLCLSLSHTGTCIKSVNTFDWGIFGAVSKCRGGGQEFSAEVIRAPGWGSWYPAIRSIFLL